MRMLTSFAACLIAAGLYASVAVGQSDESNDRAGESSAPDANNQEGAPPRPQPPQNTDEANTRQQDDQEPGANQSDRERQEQQQQEIENRQREEQRQNEARSESDRDGERQSRTDDDITQEDRDRSENDSSQSRDVADSRDERRDGRERNDQVQSAADLNVQFNAVDNGLQLTQINQASVLADSGLRRGDVLVSVQGRSIRNEADFLRWYRGFPAGSRVPLIVFRDGRRQTIYLTNTWGYDRGYDRGYVRDNDQGYDVRPGYGGAYLGVVFDDRYPDMAIVEVVRRNTAADQAGLRPGDTIQSINGQRVRGQDHATRLIASMQPGEEVDLVFARRQRTSARLGSRSEGAQVSYDEYDRTSDYTDGRRDGASRMESYERQYTGSDRISVDGRVDEYDRPGIGDNGPVRRAITRPLRDE